MKEKVIIEFSFNNISLSMLWASISSPDRLSEWFAESVTLGENNKEFVFRWGDTTQTAVVIAIRSGCYIRFKWKDEEKENNSYFEMKLSVDELTGEVTLIVTDFSEPGEKEDTVQLWEKQVEDLRRKVGL